jgi:hypothetical protein
MSLFDSKTTADDLRKAATVIKANGWTQDALYERFSNLPPQLSPCCAIGALGVAVSGHPAGIWSLRNEQAQKLSYEEREVRNRRDLAARRALSAHLGAVEVAAWNDTPGRTRAEVIAAFEAAADALEASNPEGAK